VNTTEIARFYTPKRVREAQENNKATANAEAKKTKPKPKPKPKADK